MLLVFIEHRDGKIRKCSFEVLSVAGTLAFGEVHALVVGKNVKELGESLKHWADFVHCVENPLLENYSTSAFKKVVLEIAKRINPDAILFSASSIGKDLAPRVSASLNSSFASDCTNLRGENGKLIAIRPIYAGKAFLEIELKNKPYVLTLRPNIFPIESISKNGKIEIESIEISENDLICKVVALERGEETTIDVTEADIVVSGGRGMKGPENFALLKELCSILPNCAVGASRAAVDAGWIDHQHQVGQTGKVVSPNLYMAFGISGSIQHLAGMSGSKIIVAVNKDPEAPIFKVANYGLVADLFEVIPILKEELKNFIEKTI